MITPIISDFPASCTETDALWEKPTFELDCSAQQVSLEWIQSLPPELKDAALLRFCKTVEARATLCESFALNQVLYRTISGNTFTESAESVASRTGCDRKTILKGLAQAVSQNILEENKRPGTSNEYSFKPVEEWLPEPPVRINDIRNNKIIEFHKTHCTELAEINLPPSDGVVHIKDDPETDLNTVIVINNLLEEEQQLEVSVPVVDSPSIWRRLPSGNRYAQIPPIYDQDTGVEIQRQMDSEGLTAQKVVSRAIAFSKVPLMLLEAFGAIASKLALGLSKVDFVAPKRQNKADSEEVLVSLQLSKTLDTIGVKFVPGQLEKCLREYGEDVMLNAANELKRTGVLTNKENPTGYFLGCLKNGMGQQPVTVQSSEPEREDEQQSKPKCSTTEMGQAMKPVASFSHVETNPRVTVARLIFDGQYQRAAILAGLYGIDYEELVHECGVSDDPKATILLRRVTS